MRHFLDKVANHTVQLSRFNVFAVCRVGSDEVKHSSILAWLLDSRSGHGQGSLFLEAFMKASGIPGPVPFPYRVRTEFSGSESIVDIMVCRRREYLLYMENKVFAAEGDNQVDREFRDMRELGRGLQVPEEKQFAVFLTPDGRPPVSGDPSRWISISYPVLATAFTDAITETSNIKVRNFVNDWAETVQAWGYRNAYI